jgi:hypothetical protein
VYPTQYSKIVIEVKYCACPTSELNGWVILGGRRGKRNRRNGKNDTRKQERDRRKVKKKNIPNVRLSRKQF